MISQTIIKEFFNNNKVVIAGNTIQIDVSDNHPDDWTIFAQEGDDWMTKQDIGFVYRDNGSPNAWLFYGYINPNHDKFETDEFTALQKSFAKCVLVYEEWVEKNGTIKQRNQKRQETLKAQEAARKERLKKWVKDAVEEEKKEDTDEEKDRSLDELLDDIMDDEVEKDN